MKDEDGSGFPAISVGIINYNGAGVLKRTIDSIYNSDYPSMEVLMVDDCSTDDSVALVREKYPDVALYEQAQNMGPNAARNRILNNAKNPIVFVSDNDVSLAPDCLKLLVETMTADSSVGVATPMVLDADDKKKIYSNGASLHYVCFGIVPLRHTHIPSGLDLSPRTSVCGSGGIMLIRKSAAQAIGGFDEDFIFGYDDGEFTYRMSASSMKVMQVPSAKIYHIEKTGRPKNILRRQIRGRWNLILKAYSFRSLVLLSPALLLFEFAQFCFLALKGSAGEWLRGMGLVAGDFGKIIRKRKKTLLAKKTPDNELLTTGEIYMFSHRLGGGVMASLKYIMEKLLSGYWLIVRPFLTK